MQKLTWPPPCRQSCKSNPINRIDIISNQTAPSMSNKRNSLSISRMFDSITPTYDILNHILSLGMDFYWRRQLADTIDTKKNIRILDMATGTGDVLISLLHRHPDITKAVGLDISENMLALCRRKITKYHLTDKVTLIKADAAATSLASETFDYVTMGFGIRNTTEVLATLNETHRLLYQGGKVLILEFSMPSNRIIRNCYLFYLRRFVPLVGRLLSGDFNAYRYLNTSIENFYSQENFCRLMQKAGFTNINATPLTFGIACIYQGTKPG